MLLSVGGADDTGSQSISFDVIAAVADQEGVDPIDIEPPEYESLYQAIDPEALDALFAPRDGGTHRAEGRIEFTYCSYRIVVTSAGDVNVSESTGHE